ncbi:MAG TPA: phenylalanine--tRNA ligase subunit beta [Bryobacteraceae bacterium]|nr:phenylalanine--tRNA ligase subunit beta [Bryobacteraceae bacterium]
MKFSYQWLREMVEGLETPPKELMRRITLKTAECEGVEEVGAPLESASEALVVEVAAIGASHNRKAVVETARYGQKTVVCGAANCRVGLRTVYLPAGKKIVDGVESDGMLASAAELGMTRDHSGILELHAEPMPRQDFVIEVDNKSLTHRPDLWGHHGMAREVAAITGKKLRDPVKAALPDAPAPIRVTVENFALCPRYSALVFENVTVKPSPLWLQYRLEAIGLNPINNIVDVTNFVMAEIAQPMHAFDAAKLHGGEILVRSARDGEKIAALNGESYDLDPSSLVIADPEGAVALAGVIGGEFSAISDSTTRIVLESACFTASGVRKTSSRLRLRTDASMRFEKAQDPANTIRGLKRALELLEQVSPGIRVIGGVADAYRPQAAPPPIELPLDWLDRKLGRAVPAGEVRRILESLEFRVEQNGSRTFFVIPPSWRATKDVTIKDDLVEEVGRMIGYDSITPTAPLAPARVPPSNPERAFHHRVREIAVDQGFSEVYNYSFLSEEQARLLGLEGLVEVANPIASDQNLLRSSLLPGILKNILDNARHFDSFRLFEIGREIHRDHETPHLAAAIYAKDDGVSGLLELKRLGECLLRGIYVRPAAAAPYQHPRRAAEVYFEAARLGRLFEFHPRLVESGRAAVLDLDLSLVEKFEPGVPRYQPLRRFPTSAFDLSVVAPPRGLIGDVENALRRFAGDALVEIGFLRDFSLPDGSRSISFRLTIGAGNGTLSSEEVSEIRSRVMDGMRSAGYDLRT